ncbi:hypothetical protein ACFQL1_08330 [Halomicroarcula sp. GCM10025709]|uniref:hypothetical protein n=1 Tax=Halomicroarcula sp. GCM10025709 TaxID=3252669 RepID=UPI003614FEB2
MQVRQPVAEPPVLEEHGDDVEFVDPPDPRALGLELADAVGVAREKAPLVPDEFLGRGVAARGGDDDEGLVDVGDLPVVEQLQDQIPVLVVDQFLVEPVGRTQRFALD